MGHINDIANSKYTHMNHVSRHMSEIKSYECYQHTSKIVFIFSLLETLLCSYRMNRCLDHFIANFPDLYGFAGLTVYGEKLIDIMFLWYT